MSFNEKEYIAYFFNLKAMNSNHRNLFGEDKNFEVPQLYSQDIVKHLLELDEYSGEDKKFDAEKDGKFYEIKATSSQSGTTTMNFGSKPNALIWIRFDFDTDSFMIKQFHDLEKVTRLDDFYTAEGMKKRKKDSKDPFKSQERMTIILNNVDWNESKSYQISIAIKAIDYI